jgi:tripartite-type tricarboxylate transporter receptor subunit TctC
VPSYESRNWSGIGVPRNTPANIIDRLNRETNAVLVDPKMRVQVANLAAELLPGSPADFDKLIADEIERWSKVIRAANIKL